MCPKSYVAWLLMSAALISTIPAAEDAPPPGEKGAGGQLLKEELAEARKILEELAAKLGAIEKRLPVPEGRPAKLKSLEKRNTSLEESLGAAKMELKARDSKAGEFEKRVKALEAELSGLERDLRQQMDVVILERDELAESLEAERAVFEKMNERWKSDRQQLERLQAKVKEQATTLARERSSAANSSERSNTARAQLVEEKIARQKLESQLEKVRRENAKLSSQLEALQNPPEIAPVLFTKNAAASEKEFERVLEEMNGIIDRMPEAQFLVVGHTCNLGSTRINLSLSKVRAQLLADYLTGRGVAPERITFEGRGEDDPVVPNISETNRAQNRRTEILVVLPAR